MADLGTLVLRMGGLVEQQIDHAVDALADGDTELAREVIVRDQAVNFIDVEADERIVSLLALRQPMGRDLRTILSLGKSVTDLERVGDDAKRIARMAVHINESHRLAPGHGLLRDVVPMSRLASRILLEAPGR